MKSFVPPLLIMTVLIAAPHLHAQTCGSVAFYTQSDVHQFPILHPNCDTVKGDVLIQGSDITDLSPLVQLKYIEGKLHITSNPRLKTLNGLDSLSYVEELRIEYNDSLENLMGLGGLVTAREIRIEANPELRSLHGLYRLEYVSLLKIYRNRRLKDLRGLDSTVFDAQNRTRIEIVRNDSLESFKGLENATALLSLRVRSNPRLVQWKGLENLQSIGTMEVVFTPLSSFEGLNKLESIERLILKHTSLDSLKGAPRWRRLEALYIDFEEGLTDLRGLETLVDQPRYIDINHASNLRSLRGLENVRYLDYLRLSDNPLLQNLRGLQRLHTVSQFVIIDNEQLRNLEGLLALTAVEEWTIRNNKALVDLGPLPSLRHVRSLAIERNASLKSLQGLERITADDLSALRLRENAQLSYCHVRPICDYLQSRVGDIGQNAQGCNSSDEVRMYCANYFIGGTVFYDANGNGVRDSSERGIPNVGLRIAPSGDRVLTDSEGEYTYIQLSDGDTFRVELDVPAGMVRTTDSAAYHRVFDPMDVGLHALDFGLKWASDTILLDIYTQHDLTRCGEEVPFRTVVWNYGSRTVKACVELQWNVPTEWIQTVPTPQSVDIQAGSLLVCIDSLRPFGSDTIASIFRIPDFRHRGEVHAIDAYAYVDTNDLRVLLDSFRAEFLVLCAFDPNDKQVSPVGRDAPRYVLRSMPLVYTIRFQNVGDIPARDVRIEDAIDEGLDLSTFRVLESSHPCRVRIAQQTRTVYFYFDDIHLPDSATSAEQSQGYVMYEIYPSPSLPEYSVVRNSASIYFDYNPPIHTNEVYNTVVDRYPIVTRVFPGHSEAAVVVYPNRTDAIVWISSRGPMLKQIAVRHWSGVEVVRKCVEGHTAMVDLSALPRGAYVVEVVYAGGISMHKIVLQ